ncbi:MAG: ATP-binding protein [Candidatus Scalindua sp. AMX11]|nr:MAG: ATP-binding protein [Candidatus Scalindua sp.]NOG86022.1 ATP-binding protein [Planctomycetota bacterium]RZV91353.1 MAG: ATP-binding protein [Candidatus Scalindua sp. SCAELEC01]TDE65910.1 MAG: ATP-binding protein [Candidatus Scalindua sp. AMX11]GJQ60736.1 MAG: hypothetical protein SCALA701_35370 [Candidatus Scalindua sp.]
MSTLDINLLVTHNAGVVRFEGDKDRRDLLKLFEHAVILEFIRGIRSLNEDYKLYYYWRTAGGAEVDCVIETGALLIPIEMKASSRVTLSDVRGLLSFINSYEGKTEQVFVVTNGRVSEKLSDMIPVIPWKYL